ncbi:MAG: hypothetical protein CL916_05090 [Deltaproteobacteria bacterium]|nr:hypothetical protein [Deltaproteobacteria bacterium]
MDSLESITQKIVQLSISTKDIERYQVYGEKRDSAYLTSALDSRSRWMGEIQKTEKTTLDLVWTLYFSNNRMAQKRFFVDEKTNVDELLCEMREEATPINQHMLYTTTKHMVIREHGLEIWDPRYPNITDEDRKEVIDWNMEVIKGASSRAKGREFRLEETEKMRIFYSSDGRKSTEKSTHFSLYGEVELQVRPPRRMGELHTSRHFADIASRPISIGIVRSLDSGERLTSILEEEYTVVFEGKVVASLISSILGCFSYKKIKEKESFLHRYIGKRIGSTKLHVIDDGSLPNGVNTRAFDADGIPPRPRTLICEGFIRDFYVFTQDAFVYQEEPTGHMGIDGSLWAGNIIIKSGRRSLNMILAPDEITIYCTHLLAPIQFDESTGDIEMIIGCSMMREGVRRRLHGVVLKTHVVKIFDAIDEIANTQRRIDAVDVSDWVLRDIKFEFLQEEYGE